MLHRLSSVLPTRKHRETYQARSIYEPLPAGEFLRVLKLYPGRRKDKLVCSLDTVAAEASKNQYEAISYVWGDPNNIVDVTCNGLRVAITSSLADALRTFRNKKECRNLWADAVCINQKDDQEKGHQVTRMGDIYANAKRVLVWLGSDPDMIAKDTFTLICDTNKVFGEMFIQSGCKFLTMPRLEEPYPICIDKKRWSGVDALLEHSWFKRVWTVQEAAVATECCMFWGLNSIDIADVFEICIFAIQYSSFEVLWRRFKISLAHQTPARIMSRIQSQYINDERSMWQTSRVGLKEVCVRRQEKDLVSVLATSRVLEASDPRDHVYAFLGCPSAKDEAGQAIVEADYTLSMEEHSSHVAYTLLQRFEEGPRVLSVVRHQNRDNLMDARHPSWVPQWHVGRHRGLSISARHYWYRAGGPIQRFSAHTSDKRTLKMGGSVFDKIIWTSKTLRMRDFNTDLWVRDGNKHRSGKPFIDRLWESVFQSAAEIGLPLLEDDFLMTMMRGFPGSKPLGLSQHRRTRLRAYQKVARLACTNLENMGTVTAKEQEDAYSIQKILEYTEGAELILTENGRLGLVRGRVTEIGDSCCIFFGATVPFVVTPENNGRHRLVGECYIHGVMDGELVDQLDPDGLSSQYIILE